MGVIPFNSNSVSLGLRNFWLSFFICSLVLEKFFAETLPDLPPPVELEEVLPAVFLDPPDGAEAAVDVADALFPDGSAVAFWLPPC